MRDTPVVEFDQRPEDGALRRVLDTLRAVLGKIESLVDVAMYLNPAGFVTGAAVAWPGTFLLMQTEVDTADAGVNQARLIVHYTGGGGAAYLILFEADAAEEIAAVSVASAVEDQGAGDWRSFVPSGKDQRYQVRLVGAGETPTLYSVHAQFRTVKAP